MPDPRGRSLHDIDGVDQPALEKRSMFASTLRVHRRTPIEKLGTEALRFLLEEGDSTDVLLRVALDRLERDPLQGGDFYPGDLLVTVLNLPVSVWAAAPDLRAQTFALAEDAGGLLHRLEAEDRVIVERAIRNFKALWTNGGAPA